MGRYDDAIDQFKQAIGLKPDYGNAYYNLSYAYKQQKKYPQAYLAMQNVVNLMDANTADYEKSLNELNELQKLLPKEATSATIAAQQRESQLKKPEPLPSAKPIGEVTFDEEQAKELEPPIVEVNQEATEAGNLEENEADQEATQSANP